MERCHACGFEGDATPIAEAIGAVAGFPGVVDGLLGGTSDGALRRRPRPHVWSALEYTAHTGETVSWYQQRIERVLTEEQPQLLPLDWDAACEQGRYRDLPLTTVLKAVARSCAELVSRVHVLEPAAWDRCGIGSDGSARSVAVLVRRAAHEAVHHAEDIRDGLSRVQEQR